MFEYKIFFYMVLFCFFYVISLENILYLWKLLGMVEFRKCVIKFFLFYFFWLLLEFMLKFKEKGNNYDIINKNIIRW